MQAIEAWVVKVNKLPLVEAMLEYLLGWWKTKRAGVLGAPKNLREGVGDRLPKGHKLIALLHWPDLEYANAGRFGTFREVLQVSLRCVEVRTPRTRF